jgi:hypothetical protein
MGGLGLSLLTPGVCLTYVSQIVLLMTGRSPTQSNANLSPFRKPERKSSGCSTVLQWEDASGIHRWSPFKDEQVRWQWNEPSHLSRADLPDRSGGLFGSSSVSSGSTVHIISSWRAEDAIFERAIQAGKMPVTHLKQLHPRPGSPVYVIALFELRGAKFVAGVEIEKGRQHLYGFVPLAWASSSLPSHRTLIVLCQMLQCCSFIFIAKCSGTDHTAFARIMR